MITLDVSELVAAARRLLPSEPPPGYVKARPAGCHPDRPLAARGLCRSCYELNWQRGTLDTAGQPKRTHWRQADFVAEYTHLASYGTDDAEIARRLGMTRSGLAQAKRRARQSGALPPERTPR